MRPVRCALALVVAFAISACVSDTTKGNQGGTSGSVSGGSSGTGGSRGGDTGGSSGADSGAATTPDAMAGPPKSCRDVRVCIHNCGQDMTCAGKCVSTAPPAIRQQYEEIQACSMGACPQQDEPCRCDQECFSGGMCADLVETCDDAVSDPWCDVRCH
jgi:hypothetical protein